MYMLSKKIHKILTAGVALEEIWVAWGHHERKILHRVSSGMFKFCIENTHLLQKMSE